MTAPPVHTSLPASPSAWIVRWSHLVPAGGSVLDLACGTGRHMQWFQHLGHSVTGIDQSTQALVTAAHFGSTLQADIEAGPWPLADQQFDAVVVTNYLWRPRLVNIVASVAPGGVLLYETFAAGNESVGKPSRSNFLLQPGELLSVCKGLQVVAYEAGFLEAPARFVQRIAAVRAPADAKHDPPRYALAAQPATAPEPGPDGGLRLQ